MSDLNWNRSSDSANGPTIRRMRGKVLDVHAEHWWTRSSRCAGGDCVSVARQGSIVLVQDSKNPGVYQAWSQREWGELLRCIKVGWRDGFFEFADGCVDLGLDRHDHKLSFTAAEWKAFEEDVIDDRFEFDKLREFGELSEGMSAGSGSVAGSGEAATGAVDGSGWSSDGPGSPVPVAAEQSLDDYLDITLTGPPPVNPLNIGERRDHDPTSNPASRVLPEAAQPFDSPAGRPVDVSTDEVDLSSVVQPGADAAGTGVPPDPVPVAQPEPIVSDEIVEVYRAAAKEACGYSSCACDDSLRAGLAAVYPLLFERFAVGQRRSRDDANEWARAVAPLVPADGVQ
jgi:hypothetical protein